MSMIGTTTDRTVCVDITKFGGVGRNNEKPSSCSFSPVGLLLVYSTTLATEGSYRLRGWTFCTFIVPRHQNFLHFGGSYYHDVHLFGARRRPSVPTSQLFILEFSCSGSLFDHVDRKERSQTSKRLKVESGIWNLSKNCKDRNRK